MGINITILSIKWREILYYHYSRLHLLGQGWHLRQGHSKSFDVPTLGNLMKPLLCFDLAALFFHIALKV